MSLLMVEPFQGLVGAPGGTTNGEVSLASYGLPYMAVTGTQQQTPRPWSVSLVDGWLRFTAQADGSPYNVRNGFSRLINDLVTPTSASVLLGGVRFRQPSVTKITQTGQVGIYDGSNLNSLQPFVVLSNVVLDRDYYIEWMIDIPNNKIKRRVDGVDLADIALDASMQGALLNGRARLHYGTMYGGVASTETVVADYKDGYVFDKSVDGVDSNWVGPQVVSPIAVLSADSNWTTSNGGTVVDVLNSPFTSDPATRTTPMVFTDSGGSSSLFKLDTSTVVGKITAVHVAVTAMKASGKLGNLEGSVVLDEAESSKTMMSLGTTIATYGRVFQSTKAPGGLPWTKELLADCQIKLTPIK